MTADAVARHASAALPDDATLVDALQAGDVDMFSAVVDHYHRSLLRVATTWVRSKEAAEEAVQDTWLAVITGLPRFERRASFKTWLFRILANRARTRAVRDGRLVPFSALLPEGTDDDDGPALERFAANGQWAVPPSAWDADDPEAQGLRKEVGAVIARAVEALPPAQRAVFTLRDIEGLDAADACNILDVSETNQRVLLHRARTRLRAAVEAHRTTR
ncbi:MAG: sigma-70 family RNA polymerase sigma factor [Vicinamibacterales bacterium]|nr:sigma-70 family RNA polymerase sigma factor [Vicinamibacterales bacterium]